MTTPLRQRQVIRSSLSFYSHFLVALVLCVSYVIAKCTFLFICLRPLMKFRRITLTFRNPIPNLRDFGKLKIRTETPYVTPFPTFKTSIAWKTFWFFWSNYFSIPYFISLIWFFLLFSPGNSLTVAKEKTFQANKELCNLSCQSLTKTGREIFYCKSNSANIHLLM